MYPGLTVSILISYSFCGVNELSLSLEADDLEDFLFLNIVCMDGFN